MTLNLNAIGEVYKEFSKEATGHARNVDQMPALIAEGRVPMNTAQLMQIRLYFRNGPDAVKTAWLDNYFDTGDGVAYHPDGRIKIVLDSQTLREMTPQSQRNGGALILSEDIYNLLQGVEFRRSDYKSWEEVGFKKGGRGEINSEMLKESVKAHPVWRVLARDQALLNDYADFAFAEGKKRFHDDPAGIFPGYCGEGEDYAMGVFTGSCSGNAPEMRAWHVGKFDDRSGALGWHALDNDIGRFVGILLLKD